MPTALLMRELAGVIEWISHPAAGLPLLACVVALERKRRLSSTAWLIAAAFFVSVVVDLIGWSMAQNGLNNHVLTHIAAPLQLGLLMFAIRPDLFTRAVGAMLAISATGVLFHFPTGRPELAVRTIVGIWVAVVAWQARIYRWPILLYCGVSVPLLWAWTLLTTDVVTLPWLLAWGGYQVVRVTALSLMGLMLLMQAYPRLGVAHGRSARGDAGPASNIGRAGQDRNYAGSAVRGHRVNRAVRARNRGTALARRSGQ